MDVLISVLQQCMGYIATIHVSDMVDIAIIAYLLYRLLHLFRNSRSGQVLRGIGLLLLVLWASSVLNLHVLNYILNKAVEMGFVAIVVVFQPEIRHFLEQMGSRRGIQTVFSREEQGSELEAAIDELVDAYASMSRDKIGALTVFERTSILDDCIKSGTALDAAVSSELMKNIFWPKAPMHDGAAIIREGRLAGAGCVLPLSGNPSISKELGTRHRAGIGITEHTDAVTAICSEETGSISVAVNGRLRRHLSPDTMRRILRNELLVSEEETKKNINLNNLSSIATLFRPKKEDKSHEKDK